MRAALLAILVASLLPGAETAFVLFDGLTGKTVVENASAARRRVAPCSTFKIPNSLIALESKVVSDAAFPLDYDPKRDGEQAGAWSRDHDLRSAMSNSVVWYYREVARRIGTERMRTMLERFDYGNRDISGGIDKFWLGSSLRISAEEQVEFLRRMREGRLGVSGRILEIVRDILLVEAAPDYRWYGKTGMCSDGDQGPVVWHVGFIERQGHTSYYALNLTGGTYEDLRRERAIVLRQKLSKAGLILAEPPSKDVQMRAQLDYAITAAPGVVGLYAKNLDSGQTFGIRENERVRTASTIKLPIMAAVFTAVQAGKAKWDDTIEMKEDDKISGSGVIREMAAGTRFTIRDLVHMMIVVSDNTATNLLLDRFTADYVNGEMDKLGLQATRSLRKVLGDGKNLKPVASGHSREGLQEEFRRFGLGVATPREMVDLLEKIERRDVVSPDASREMLAILGRQQYKDGIGRHFDEERVVSKSGSLDRLRSDVGIVYSEGGRIAMAITVDGTLRTDYSPDNGASLLISDLAQILVSGLSVPVQELAPPEKKVELQAPMDHVQGIEVDGQRLWVSWVDRKQNTGHLGEFDLASGKLVRSVAVHKGHRFHPGGIAADGDSLWVPVAEYRRNSSAVIQRRNKKTLELEAEFEVPDHIGCVAVSNGRLYGGNWDSRQIYVWDLTGKLIEKRDNPSGTSFQDLKGNPKELIGGGLRPNGGSIDWLSNDDLHLLRRIRVGKTDRGVNLAHEGMAIHDGRLYVLPEDGPSRLFVFPLH